MRTYSEHRPTAFDSHIEVEGRENWFVVLGRNRDSDCLTESNFAVALKMLGGESDTVEVHRFGHWACGWYELILVQPGTDAEKTARQIRDDLDGYPVLDEDDFSRREQEAADEVWKTCMRVKDRIDFIRRYRSEFEFHSFADLLGCVRGKYYAGYASTLLS